MTLPILILAVPSALAGWLGRDFFRAQVRAWAADPMGGGAAVSSPGMHGAGGASGAEWLPIVATLLAVSGVAASWYWYGMKNRGPGFPGRAAPAWYRVLADKFYVDEAYLFLAKRVAGRWIAGPADWIERHIVNGAFDLVTGVLRGFAFVQSLFHNGQIQVYISVALMGLCGLWLLALSGGLGF